MAGMAAVLPMVSTAMSVVGAITQASAQSDSYASQQQAMEYNAQVSQQNANNAMAVANANEDAQRRKNAYLLGEKRAGLVQAGIGTDGSASDVLQQSAQNLELDALNIRYEGALKAQGYGNQSNLDLMKADAAGQNADTAMTNGIIGAGGAALSGYSNYVTGQQSSLLTQLQINRMKSRGGYSSDLGID